jgi:hypothetical protein
MSVEAMTWAFAQAIKPAQKIVLLVLANSATPEGVCQEEVSTLEYLLDNARPMTARVFQRHVRQLEALELVTRTPRYDAASGRQLSNHYRLAMGEGGNFARVPPRGCGEGGSFARGGRVTELRQGEGGKTATPKDQEQEKDKEPDLEERKEGEEREERPVKKERSLVVSWQESFRRFWARYPRKIGKGAAEKAWQKLNPSPELVETILAQVEAAQATEQWQKDGGAFIPLPATWLNQRRWEDEYVPAASARPTSLVDAALRRAEP